MSPTYAISGYDKERTHLVLNLVLTLIPGSMSATVTFVNFPDKSSFFSRTALSSSSSSSLSSSSDWSSSLSSEAPVCFGELLEVVADDVGAFACGAEAVRCAELVVVNAPVCADDVDRTEEDAPVDEKVCIAVLVPTGGSVCVL